MHRTHMSLEEHIAEEHKMSPISEYLKEIVYGGNDGIVTTFAVVAGFNGAALGDQGMEIGIVAVILFGLANLFSDASSMGLGNFLAIRSEQHLYRFHRRKEEEEIRENPDMEYKETVEILMSHKGMSKEDATSFANLYMKYPDYWADFMMDYELEMPNSLGDNPTLKSIATFLSFLFFGVIPLLPYFFQKDNLTSLFTLSCLATFGALVLLGILRWKVTKETWWRAIGETVLLGGISALIAYGVGTFFK